MNVALVTQVFFLIRKMSTFSVEIVIKNVIDCYVICVMCNINNSLTN